SVPEQPWPFLEPNSALFTHLEGVAPFSGLPSSAQDQDSLPYPPEWAAVHHVFEDGWIWSLRFDNGNTSVGVAASPRLSHQLDLSSGDRGWENLLRSYPSLHHFRRGTPIRP